MVPKVYFKRPVRGTIASCHPLRDIPARHRPDRIRSRSAAEAAVALYNEAIAYLGYWTVYIDYDDPRTFIGIQR